jgi:predicted NACHT family NTPase
VTRRWVVRGDPGSGKTTLLRHLAARLAEESPPRWVPVFQSLPVLLRKREFLLDRIERQMGRADHRGMAAVLEREGQEGRLLLLLDGLDEVEDREDAETLLRQLSERWPRTPLVVTTRPIGYRRFDAAFRELELQPFDRERRCCSSNVRRLVSWHGT